MCVVGVWWGVERAVFERVKAVFTEERRPRLSAGRYDSGSTKQFDMNPQLKLLGAKSISRSPRAF